ncbi:hypothetical protein BC829DRAFT_393774 [Chytridium lagenaria]|nr:hypothetical protein BC829DRAFT_393774 [Chytridium lagenaria]
MTRMHNNAPIRPKPEKILTTSQSLQFFDILSLATSPISPLDSPIYSTPMTSSPSSTSFQTPVSATFQPSTPTTAKRPASRRSSTTSNIEQLKKLHVRKQLRRKIMSKLRNDTENSGAIIVPSTHFATSESKSAFQRTTDASGQPSSYDSLIKNGRVAEIQGQHFGAGSDDAKAEDMELFNAFTAQTISSGFDLSSYSQLDQYHAMYPFHAINIPSIIEPFVSNEFDNIHDADFQFNAENMQTQSAMLGSQSSFGYGGSFPSLYPSQTSNAPSLHSYSLCTEPCQQTLPSQFSLSNLFQTPNGLLSTPSVEKRESGLPSLIVPNTSSPTAISPTDSAYARSPLGNPELGTYIPGTGSASPPFFTPSWDSTGALGAGQSVVNSNAYGMWLPKWPSELNMGFHDSK